MGRILVTCVLVMLLAPRHSTGTCTYDTATDTIDLSGRNITNVTQDTFSTIYNCTGYYTTATSINLANSNIATVAADSFDNFFELKNLNISNNYLTHVDNTTFTSLLNLEFLDLSYNLLTELRAGLLDILSLKQVYFQNNIINYVQPGIVSAINVNLVYFNMNDNLLTSFEPWPYLTNVTSDRRLDRLFDIQRNLIANISNSMNWTYNLQYPYQIEVNLQGNKLTTLDIHSLLNYLTADDYGDVFFAVFLAMHINATSNPYFCDCKLYYLTHVLRDGVFRWREIDRYAYLCASPSEVAGIDFLHYLPDELFICNRTDNCPTGCRCEDRPHNDTFFIDCRNAGLTGIPKIIPENERSKIELLLDFNHIQTLKYAPYFEKINKLSMSYNALQSLDPVVLKSMANATQLDFTGNALESVPREIQLFDYSYVRLAGNPLKCDCDSLWFSEWMKLGKDNSDKSLTCESDVGTHALIELNLDDMNCTYKNLIIIGICVGILLIVLILISIVVKRCPKGSSVLLFKFSGLHPLDKYKVDDTDGKPVDIYLSFDSDDLDVVGWLVTLIDKLRQKKPLYSILNPERFAEPGSEKDLTMKWIGKSKRVIIVLSEKYFDNARHCFAADAAEQLRAEAAGEGDKADDCSEIEFANDIMDDQDNTSYELDDNKDFRKPAAKIVYIIYNSTEALEDKLKEDPWKTRLAHSIVLKADDRMFMWRLRYELPPNGNGVGDGVFRGENTHHDSKANLQEHPAPNRPRSGGGNRVEPLGKNSLDYENERAQRKDFNHPRPDRRQQVIQTITSATQSNTSQVETPQLLQCLHQDNILPGGQADEKLRAGQTNNGSMNNGRMHVFGGGNGGNRLPQTLGILHENEREHIV